MNGRIMITIKKRSQPGWLIWLLIMLPFLFGTLNDFLGLPGAIRYLLDAAWFLLIIYLFRADRLGLTKGVRNLIVWITLLLLYTAIIYLVQFQSPFYYFWGVRNNFRFYVAFFAFAVFLSEKDIDHYLGLFDKLFWLNVAVSLFQFLALGVKQDFLGGLFGSTGGTNGYTNIFFLIVTAKSIVSYLEKRESTWLCILKCVAALLVAALAELKFFYVEFIIIIILASIFTNFTWRKFWLIAGGVAAVVFSTAFLSVLFPYFADFFSVEWFIETATSDKGYTSSGDLNRLNAIPQINELWLTGWGERIFGLGLGNCDTSGFAIVNTPFFERYGDMHYTWLSYAMIYLETGWIGLIFYFGFFILVYRGIHRVQKRSQGMAVTHCVIGKIMTILCMIISIYNSSLRAESGYMAYFMLAIPFIHRKNEKK